MTTLKQYKTLRGAARAAARKPGGFSSWRVKTRRDVYIVVPR